MKRGGLFSSGCFPATMSSTAALLILILSSTGVSAGSHTLQYQHTAVRGINSTEVIAVGLLDGEQLVFYNASIKMLRTMWIWNINASYADYYDSVTENMEDQQDHLRAVMKPAMELFNHTEGVHIFQRMYGCELDDDGTTRGYDQFGLDGEDLISLDLKTGTYTGTKPQAVKLVKKWDPKDTRAKSQKSYLENECIDRLNTFVSYANETLGRKVRPEASVFQKHSSSPEVVCHATAFFPKALNITWQKDGEDLIEDVELTETLPNQNGSFQKRSILKVPAEELQKHKYTCVVQHSSLEKELVLPVSERRILRDGGSGRGRIGIFASIILLAAVLGIVAFSVLLIAGIRYMKKWCEMKHDKVEPSPERIRMIEV
ncbi:class I histocompatibility antigen, Non-RT1.A alpha-1 chain-like isoform X2 [Neoarius graeffei]|uniref:class I histocompatibility antigen, Non-RT1.A alpha-1 chain-like isoform X2 n=1 Tax=Neoarius graeffei TaxID=443677 RepID=UPI00298C29C7|nr:class I histocompatibility antigen, Non-RT1.A alpha-1 chain-like isoform X2 [Neoarius graeffei]